MFYDQSRFDLRCEWGPSGVRLVGNLAEVLVVVDVLSFSTCVEVATSRGAVVYPFRWKDDRANLYAEQLDAELAATRGVSGRYSLSPISMLGAVHGTRIVLPSPNGSELSSEAGTFGRIVIAGCFRNFQAVARYATASGKSIAVIASGERWPDGTLRPAFEDLAAAGAILEMLPGSTSPEAQSAISVWGVAKKNLGAFLGSCSSGRELIELGFENDVGIAAEANVSECVPILREMAFVRA